MCELEWPWCHITLPVYLKIFILITIKIWLKFLPLALPLFFFLPPSSLFPIFVGSNLLRDRNLDLYKVHINNRVSFHIYLPIHGHVFHRRNHLPSPPPSSTSGLSPLYCLNESGHWSFSCHTLFWFGVLSIFIFQRPW